MCREEYGIAHITAAAPCASAWRASVTESATLVCVTPTTTVMPAGVIASASEAIDIRSAVVIDGASPVDPSRV